MINFLFSFKQLGGVPSLFYNLATQLQKHDTPFRLIAFQDSAIYDMFTKLQKPFAFADYNLLTPANLKNSINSDDVLIVTWWDPKLILFKEINPRILFWNVFPDTLLYSNQVRKNIILHFRNKRLLKIMLQNKGLVFMDSSPLDWIINYKEIEIGLDNYLPVPVIVNDLHHPVNPRSDLSELRITYIARAETWKLYPLVKIIKDLTELNTNLKATLIIVTDSIQKVKSFLSDHFLSDKKVILDFYENISTEKLPAFLLANSDINIAMGVSCLDSAKVGIPTLLIDPSDNIIKNNYRYKWIYETEGFNLGRFYKDEKAYSGKPLNEIINNIIQSKKYLHIEGMKCYEYTKEFHNIESIIIKFLNHVEKSDLRINDLLKNVYQYSMVNRLKKMLLKRYLRRN